MTAIDAPPKATFRIDMLWNDSRYRSSFIQIVALFVTITMLYLIVQNVVDNLAALGKEFGFSFMQQPAGYDINQRPIDYNSRDSHARAAVIGIMNTLLVAIVGCFLATIIGVLAGVARLSKNWMLRSLMSVYVELVRNVPVLIQILLVSALITETMPAPRAFRGEDPVATMWLFDSVAATNRGFYFPAPVLGDGSWLVVTAFILAIVGAVIFGRWAMQYQQQTGEELPEKAQPLVWVGAVLLGLISLPFAYAIAQLVVLPFVKLLPFGLGLLVEALAYPLTPIIAVGIGYVFLNMRLLSVKAAIVLGVPLIVFILIWPVTGLPIGLELPSLQGFNFQGGIYARESYVSLTLALAIYTGGFIAENVRAGIQAVSKGQTEASYALGLQPSQNMSLVVLPQALRIIIPPLISQYLNLTKNSSLALLVGYMDVTGTLMGISLNQTGREFETLFLGMAVYLTISLSIAAIMNLYNENTKLVERTSSYGVGFSVRSLFDGFFGPWEKINKGDAKMRPEYGIRRELNLFVLFYAVLITLLINYVFLEAASDLRPSYWDWGLGQRAAALGMLVLTFATFITCCFKSGRFIDFVALEFVVFVFAILLGFPFGELIGGVGATVFVAVTAACRLAIFGYTLSGRRPNVTFFQRIPREA